MGTVLDKTFYVFKEDMQYLCFYECQQTKVYYLDIKEDENKDAVINVITVRDQAKQISNLYVDTRKELHRMQPILVCPINGDLTNAIEINAIGNNSYTRNDIKTTNYTFRSSVPGLKGKSMKHRASHQEKMNPW